MAKKVETRRYPMSDADLKRTGDDIISRVTRDLIDFNKRQVTQATITGLQDMVTNFDDHETDEELQGVIMDATQAKDTIGDDIRKKIRTIRNMADLQYSGAGKYNSFGFDDMANMSDNELYRLSKRVLRVANKLTSELAAQGLTVPDITALTTVATQFDAAIDAQHEATENRDLATEARITQGNMVWDELVRICSIGKSIYEDTDEAKYNDYVLTPTTTQTATPAASPTQPA